MFTKVAGFIFPFCVRLQKHFKMSDRGGFLVSKTFCQLPLRSEFSKNTCEVMQACMVAKENIVTDSFNYNYKLQLKKTFVPRITITSIYLTTLLLESSFLLYTNYVIIFIGKLPTNYFKG